MRILHTSDWHLGQNFYTQNRQQEHQDLIDWILQKVGQLHIDAVIIAGDIFDTGTPPSYARQLYNQFVLRLSQVNCQLLVLGGNHDAVAMLNESKQLLAALNVHVIPNTEDDLNNQIVTLYSQNGEAGAVVCAIPFIRPRDILKSQAGDSSKKKQQALGEAIAEHYKMLYEMACAKREALYETTQNWLPIIATGHLTAMGVKSSESVRDIYIGNLDGFDANGFPPADYIALGHIHRPQIVAKKEHIRYSGSPIILSFDEANKEKQVLVVDFESSARDTAPKVSIQPLPIPSFQPIATLSCDLDGLAQEVEKLCEKIDLKSGQLVWLQLEINTQDYLSDLQDRVDQMMQDFPVKILQLRRKQGKRNQSLTSLQKQTLTELSVQEVFEKRLALEAFHDDSNHLRLARVKTQFQKIYQEIESQHESKPAHIASHKMEQP